MDIGIMEHGPSVAKQGGLWYNRAMNETAFAIGTGVALVVLLHVLAYIQDGKDGLVGMTVAVFVIMPLIIGLIIGTGLLCGWLWR